MSSLLEAPVVLIALSYLSLVLYWYLRVVATRTGSYRALAELQGPPRAVEKGIWTVVLIAGAFFIAASCATTNDYRTLSTFSLRPGAHLEDVVGVVSPIQTVHKGRTRCANTILVGAIRFSVDVRCGATRILSVRTTDPKFITADGIAIGHEMEAAKKVPGARLLPNGDVQLPSGWVAHAENFNPPKISYFTSPEEE